MKSDVHGIGQTKIIVNLKTQTATLKLLLQVKSICHTFLKYTQTGSLLKIKNNPVSKYCDVHVSTNKITLFKFSKTLSSQLQSLSQNIANIVSMLKIRLISHI